MRSRIEGITVSQGFSAAKIRRGASVIAAPPITRSLMNSRRVVICFSNGATDDTDKHGFDLCSSVSSVAQFLFPRRIIFFQQFNWFFNIPVVTRSSLVFDFGDTVFHHAITAHEDRSIAPDLIKACPNRTTLRIFNHDTIIVLLDPLDAFQLRLLKPRDRSLDRLDHARRRILDRHQEANNPDTLTTTQRNRFELSRARGRECDFIVLRAPDSAPPVHNDLRLQNALDSFFHRPRGSRAPSFVDKSINRLSCRHVT